MGLLKIQSPDGKIVTIDSPDNSIPSESELDQIFFSLKPSMRQEMGKQALAASSVLPGPGQILQALHLSGIKNIPGENIAQRTIGSMALGSLEPYGIPQAIERMTGQKIEPARDLSESLPELIGGIAGSIPLYQRASRIVSALPALQSAKLLPTIVRGTATGGLAGIPSGHPVEGAITGAILEPIAQSSVQAFQALKRARKANDYMKEIRSKAIEVKDKVGGEMGEEVDRLELKYPETRIDLSQVMSDVAKEINPGIETSPNLSYNPSLHKSLNTILGKSKDTLLSQVLKNPNIASNLTLRQSQSLIQSLKKAPGLMGKFKQGRLAKYQDIDIPILDLMHKIRASQLEAFDEFRPAVDKYREVLTNYDKIRPYLSEGSLEKQVLSKPLFGTSELETRAENLLGKPMIEEMKRFRNMTNIGRRTIQAATSPYPYLYGILGALGLYGLGRRFTSDQ